MTGEAPDATATIRVARTRTGHELHLSSPYGRPARIRDVADPKEVYAAYRASLAPYAGVRLNQSDDEAADTLNDLLQIGHQSLLDLVGAAEVRRVRAWFSDMARRAPAERDRVRTVEVISPFPLPIDGLPLFERQAVPTPGGGTPGLAVVTGDARARLFGLRMAAQQRVAENEGRPVGTMPRSRILGAPDPGAAREVPIAVFRSGRLQEVDGHLHTLGELPSFSVAAHQPDDRLMRERESVRRDRMALMLAQGGPERPAAIAYVFAHADTSHESSAHHVLHFGTSKLFKHREIDVELHDISNAADLLGLPEAGDGPLAIIAACAAAKIVYTQPSSIPIALREIGHRAVVAPLVSVSTAGASAFCEALLRRLGLGEPLGTAIVRSRRASDDSTGALRLNLTGLLFHTFGDVGLAIHSDAVS